MTKTHGDFETRSALNLKKCGIYVYARHPSTDILCFAWQLAGRALRLWLPGQPMPNALRRHVDDGLPFYAENVPFEYEIWNCIAAPRYGFAPLSSDQVYCTQALGLSMAYPGSLDKSAEAMNLVNRKDPKGHRVMMQLSKPRKVIK